MRRFGAPIDGETGRSAFFTRAAALGPIGSMPESGWAADAQLHTLGQRCNLSRYGGTTMTPAARRIAMIAGLVAVILGAAVALGLLG